MTGTVASANPDQKDGAGNDDGDDEDEEESDDDDGYTTAKREFLFFGDVESEWRQVGAEGYDAAGAKRAGDMCRAIWQEAATSWDEGRLAGIFVSPSTFQASDMVGEVGPTTGGRRTTGRLGESGLASDIRSGS